MIGRVSHQIICFIVFCFWAAVSASPTEGQDKGNGAQPNKKPDVILRKLNVPVERLEEVITESYLPVKRTRFDELIGPREMTSEVDVPRIDVSQHVTRLTLRPDGVLQGTGRALMKTVESVPGTIQVSWNSRNVVFRDLRWVDFASVPVVPRANRSGKISIPMIGRGWLDYSVSIAPESNAGLESPQSIGEPTGTDFGKATGADAIYEYTFQFPEVAKHTLLLQISSELRPVVNTGMVQEVVEVPQEDSSGNSIWRWEFSGGNDLNLKLVEKNTPATPLQPYRLVSTHEYGLEREQASITIKVEPTRGWHAGKLSVVVPSSVDVGQVQLKGAPLSFVEKKLNETQDIVEIDLTESQIVGDANVGQLVVTGIQPFSGELNTLGRALFPGAIWLRGTTVVELGKDLDESDLSFTRLRIQKVEQVTRETGNVVRFRLIDRENENEIRLQRRVPKLVAESQSLTIVSANASDLNASYYLRIRPISKDRLEYQVELQPGWGIESVALVDRQQLLGTNRIESWETGISDGVEVLTVRFREPLPLDKGCLLSVNAKRLGVWEPSAPIGLSILSIGRPRNTAHRQSFVLLNAIDRYRWATSKGDVLATDPESSLPADFQSEVTLPSGVLVVSSLYAEEQQFNLVPNQEARVETTVDMNYVVSGTEVIERIEFTFSPRGGSVRQLTFSLLDIAEENWEWQIVDNSQIAISEHHRLSETEFNEHYRLKTYSAELTRVTRQPIKIGLIRKRKWSQSSVLPLAVAEGGTRFAATVNVQTFASNQVRIQNHDLQRIARKRSGSESRNIGNTQFIYEQFPSRQVVLSFVEEKLPLPDPLCVNYRTESWLGRATSRHLASFTLTGLTSKQLDLKLPAGTRAIEVHQVFKDYRAELEPTVSDGKLQLVLEPGAEAKNFEILLEETSQLPLVWGAYSPPKIQFDIPVLHYSWECELPEGYELHNRDGEQFGAATSPLEKVLKLIGMGSPAESEWMNRKRLTLDRHKIDFAYLPQEVQLLHQSGISSIRNASFLPVCLLSLALLVLSRRAWIVVLIGILTAVPFLPAIYEPVLTTILIAFPFSFLTYWAWSRRERARRYSKLTLQGKTTGERQVRDSAISKSLATILFLSIYFLNGNGIEGQENQNGSPKKRDYVKIINPVDAQGNATGDVIYLPKDFYDHILRTDRTTSSGISQYYITSASHELVPLPQVDTKKLGVALKSRYVVETESENAVVELPVQPIQVQSQYLLTKVDNQATSLQRFDRDTWNVRVPTRGRHTIDLTLHLTELADSATGSFVVLPTGTSDLRIDSGLSSRLRIIKPNLVLGVTPFGFSTQTTIPTTDSISFVGTPPAKLVDGATDFGWAVMDMKVTGDDFFADLYVLVDRSKLAADGELALELSKDWTIDPARVGDDKSGSDPRKLRNVTGQPNLAITSSRIRPRVSVVAGRVTVPEIRLAPNVILPTYVTDLKSPQASLLFDAARKPLDELKAAELRSRFSQSEKLWENASWIVSSASSANVQLFPFVSTDSMQLQRSESYLTADEDLEATIEHDGITFKASVFVSPLRGAVNVMRINVPMSTAIRSVTASNESGEIKLETSLVNEGGFWLFFAQPLTQAFELKLEGLMRPQGEQFALPVLDIADSNQTVFHARLFHADGIQLSMSQGQNLRRVTENEKVRDGSGRWPAWQLEFNDAAIRANDSPKITVTGRQDPEIDSTISLFSPSESSYRWVGGIHFAEESHDVTRIVVDLPNSLTQLDASPDFNVAGSLALGDRQRFWLALTKPMGRGQTLALRASRLSLPVGDWSIQVVNSTRHKRHVLLPISSKDQTTGWSVIGGEIATIPDWVASLQVEVANFEAYRVQNDALVVSINEKLAPSRAGRIEYSEHNITFVSESELILQSKFWVRPDQTHRLPINLPAGAQVLALKVEGIEQNIIPVEEGKVQLELPFGELPQRVEVLIRNSLKADGVNRFQALLPTSDFETAWTKVRLVDGDRSREFAEMDNERVSNSDWETGKILLAVADSVQAATADSPAVRQAWLASWSDEIESIVSEIDSFEQLPGDSVTDRLNGLLLGNPNSENAATSRPSDVERVPLGNSVQILFKGKLDQVPFQAMSIRQAWLGLRMIALILAPIIVGGLVFWNWRSLQRYWHLGILGPVIFTVTAIGWSLSDLFSWVGLLFWLFAVLACWDLVVEYRKLRATRRWGKREDSRVLASTEALAIGEPVSKSGEKRL